MTQILGPCGILSERVRVDVFICARCIRWATSLSIDFDKQKGLNCRFVDQRTISNASLQIRDTLLPVAYQHALLLFSVDISSNWFHRSGLIPILTMCIVFTCGEHTFRKEVEGYNGLVCRCYNCGNYSGSVVKSHPWFTFCFIVSLETPQSPLPTRCPARRPRGLASPSGATLTQPRRATARDPALDEGLRRRLVPRL